jgi:hypothetical protein
MSQIFGKVGLLLGPVGALWVASGYWRRLAAKQHGIGIAALVACSLVWVIVSLGALVSSGLSLAVFAAAIGIYAISRALPPLKSLKTGTQRPTRAMPLYLLIVPIAVMLLQAVVVPPAIEFSRGRAIQNSARLIADIEQYRTVHGRYPPLLLSVWEDYLPGIIGIKEYHYEPRGDAYNLFFEQFALHFGTREFVMYNPRDEHALTSHKMDLLQLTPQQLALEQTRGHYAVHDAPQPHWKYFWYD